MLASLCANYSTAGRHTTTKLLRSEPAAGSLFLHAERCCKRVRRRFIFASSTTGTRLFQIDSVVLYRSTTKNMDEAEQGLGRSEAVQRPTKMRAAIDQAQKDSASMKEHMHVWQHDEQKMQYANHRFLLMLGPASLRVDFADSLTLLPSNARTHMATGATVNNESQARE